MSDDGCDGLLPRPEIFDEPDVNNWTVLPNGARFPPPPPDYPQDIHEYIRPQTGYVPMTYGNMHQMMQGYVPMSYMHQMMQGYVPMPYGNMHQMQGYVPMSYMHQMMQGYHVQMPYGNMHQMMQGYVQMPCGNVYPKHIFRRNMPPDNSRVSPLISPYENKPTWPTEEEIESARPTDEELELKPWLKIEWKVYEKCKLQSNSEDEPVAMPPFWLETESKDWEEFNKYKCSIETWDRCLIDEMYDSYLIAGGRSMPRSTFWDGDDLKWMVFIMMQYPLDQYRAAPAPEPHPTLLGSDQVTYLLHPPRPPRFYRGLGEDGMRTETDSSLTSADHDRIIKRECGYTTVELPGMAKKSKNSTNTHIITENENETDSREVSRFIGSMNGTEKFANILDLDPSLFALSESNHPLQGWIQGVRPWGADQTTCSRDEYEDLPHLFIQNPSSLWSWPTISQNHGSLLALESGTCKQVAVDLEKNPIEADNTLPDLTSDTEHNKSLENNDACGQVNDETAVVALKDEAPFIDILNFLGLENEMCWLPFAGTSPRNERDIWKDEIMWPVPSRDCDHVCGKKRRNSV